MHWNLRKQVIDKVKANHEHIFTNLISHVCHLEKCQQKIENYKTKYRPTVKSVQPGWDTFVGSCCEEVLDNKHKFKNKFSLTCVHHILCPLVLNCKCIWLCLL